MIEAGIENDDHNLTVLEERIRKLEQEISPDQMERGQQEVKSLLPDTTGDSKSEEWKRLALETASIEPMTDRARLQKADDEVS